MAVERAVPDKVHIYREAPLWKFATPDKSSGTSSKGETPASIGITFIFSTRLSDIDERGSIRLDALNRRLQNERPDVWQRLVEPVSSFLTDIAPGELGRRGRPLIFSAEPACGIAERRCPVLMRRPTATCYSAENRHVELHLSSEIRREITFELRDSFVLFESGHLFYLVTLVPSDNDELAKIDEYSLIQLRKIINHNHEATGLREDIRFDFRKAKDVTFVDVIRSRIEELASGGKNVQSPNAVRDILHPYVSNVSIAPDWSDLRFLLIAIEDDLVLRDSKAALEASALPAGSRSETTAIDTASDGGIEVSKDDKCQLPSHMDRAREDARLFVLAGFLQGVLDFPFQDRSELLDSLKPVFRSDDFLAFGHPLFHTGIGCDWRTIREMKDCIGTCPYLLLTQCMLLYNEILLESVEKEIDALLHPPGRVRMEGIRVRTMADVVTIATAPQRFLRTGTGAALKQNLQRRIDIFRDLLVFRAPNIFRYNLEKELFDNVARSRGLDARYKAAIDLLERYEELIKDAHDMRTLAATQRLNILLMALAVVGFVSALDSFDQLFELDLARWQSSAIIGAALAAVAIWLWRSPPD